VQAQAQVKPFRKASTHHEKPLIISTVDPRGSATLTPLEPDTKYAIRARARGVAGWGGWNHAEGAGVTIQTPVEIKFDSAAMLAAITGKWAKNSSVQLQGRKQPKHMTVAEKEEALASFKKTKDSVGSGVDLERVISRQRGVMFGCSEAYCDQTSSLLIMERDAVIKEKQRQRDIIESRRKRAYMAKMAKLQAIADKEKAERARMQAEEDHMRKIQGIIQAKEDNERRLAEQARLKKEAEERKKREEEERKEREAKQKAKLADKRSNNKAEYEKSMADKEVKRKAAWVIQNWWRRRLREFAWEAAKNQKHRHHHHHKKGKGSKTSSSKSKTSSSKSKTSSSKTKSRKKSTSKK